MKILLVILLFLSASCAEARLGWTRKEIEAKYGKAVGKGRMGSFRAVRYKQVINDTTEYEIEVIYTRKDKRVVFISYRRVKVIIHLNPDASIRTERMPKPVPEEQEFYI